MSRIPSFLQKTLFATAALSCMATSCLAKESLPNVELTGGLLFQIIASEFALQRQDPASAFQTYMQTARTTKDPRLAKRAFEIADGAHAFEQAAEAARLWENLSPENVDAQLAKVLSQIRQGDLSNKTQENAKKLILQAQTESEKLKRFSAITLQAELGSQEKQQVLNFVRPLAAVCHDKKEAALTLAKLYRQTGNEEIGRRYAKEAWEQLPDNTVALLEYADCLMSHESQQAIRILERFVQKHPQDYDAQLGLAKAYARTQNKEGVKKQLQILEPFTQTLPNLAFTLASVCDNVGLMDETKRFLMIFERTAKKQNAFSDRLPRTYLSLGMIDYRQHHYEAAAEWFNQVEKNSEFYPQARLFLAQSLAANKQFEQALKVLDKTEVKGKIRTDFLHKRAQILYESGKNSQAYNAMKEALDSDPKNASILFQCAIMANDLKRLDEAEKYLLKAIELYPNEADFYNTLGYLWIDNNIKIKQARPMIEKALSIEPNNAAYLDSMGWLLYREGNFKQAQYYLEKAVSIFKDKEIMLHLIEIYQLQGNTPQAMEILRQLLKQSPDDPAIHSLMDRLNLHF